MPLKLSVSAARLGAIDTLVFKPDPSNTTWSKLEPMPTSDDIALGLQAPVADPLWMVARQWQLNELRGEDAGSPIGAELRVLGVPLSRLRHPSQAVPERVLADAAPPIEALVEHERVLAAHPKLNAQAGQHLMRLLRAAAQDAAIEPLRGKYPAAIEAPSDAVADNAGFVWHRLLHQRAIDAQALAADLRPLDDAGRDALLAGLAIAAPAAVRAVLATWLVWLDDLALEPGTPQGASPYWNPQRLEYGFGLRSDGVQPELRLDADEYADGRLDWHSFTVSAGVAAPGQPVFGNAPIQFVPQKPPMPTVARYPGMPADRYWEFEDGRVNFGRIGAAKSDLARLAVMEYALVFGNDWFLLPVTLPVNAVYKVDRFEVTDNFGIPVDIPPGANLDGSQWTMFELSTKAQQGGLLPRPRLDDCMYLCPALHSREGAALEEVRLARDEMANLVWAVEKKVQGTSGEPLDRAFESTRLSTRQSLRAPLGVEPVPGGAPLHYTLQTPVAGHWIPFLPVRRKGATPQNWSVQLQRGVVVQHYLVDAARLADERNAQYAAVIARLRNTPFVEPKPEEAGLQGFMFHPRGEILRLTPADEASLFSTDFLRLEDEEVPRDGVVVKRAFNYARDANGRGLLWIGRSKKTGRGEGASGLRFDGVQRGRAR